jgi:hypothetical protein
MVLIEEYVYQGIIWMDRTRTLPNGELFIAKVTTYQLNDSPCVTENTFDAILVAKSSLDQKLSSVIGKPYTRRDILDVFSAIVKSGHGYVPYNTLIQLVGSVQVNTMIDQNIIHYRPLSAFYTDLHPFPKSAVVTAAGTHALRAMEALLQDYSPDTSSDKDKPEQKGIFGRIMRWMNS